MAINRNHDDNYASKPPTIMPTITLASPWYQRVDGGLAKPLGFNAVEALLD